MNSTRLRNKLERLLLQNPQTQWSDRFKHDFSLLIGLTVRLVFDSYILDLGSVCLLPKAVNYERKSFTR